MLSDDIRHLCTQVQFFHQRELHSPHFEDLLIERLDALADRAAALEAAVVPDAQRRMVEAGGTVVRFDDARRRLGR